MTESSNSDNPRADADGAVRLVTVEPLEVDSAAALAPAPDLGIRAAYLVLARHRWCGAHNLETSRRAPDLLAAAAAYPDICDLFPNGAELVEAGIEVCFEDCVKPCFVELKPPGKWVVQQTNWADRIQAFLIQRGFLRNAGAGGSSEAPAKCQPNAGNPVPCP